MRKGAAAGLAAVTILAWAASSAAERVLDLGDAATLALFLLLSGSGLALLWRHDRARGDPAWLAHYGGGWVDWSQRWTRLSVLLVALSAATVTLGLAISEDSPVLGFGVAVLGALLL